MENKKTKLDSSDLRISFIGMLFALAIGQSAIEFGDFFSNESKFHDHLYVFSHLGLAIYIIASSWIGWQTSDSTGNNKKLNDSFSISFIILMIDLCLVIFYFILVKGVEKPDKNILVGNPEAKTEIFWSLSIFAAYFIWDVITKLFKIETGEKFDFSLDWYAFKKRGFQSLMGFLLILFIIKPMEEINTNWGVVMTDIGLFSIFAMFRGFKSDMSKGKPNKFLRHARIFVYRLIPIAGLIVAITFNYLIHV